MNETNPSCLPQPSLEGTSSPLVPVQSRGPEPPVRLDGLLGRLELAFLRVNRGAEGLLSPALNPLTQTGAIANVMFLVASVSGILLLFWYSPSVHKAYESVRAMEGVWAAEFLRSIHRYSSDGCILFVLLHALHVVLTRRFSGPRWVAWVTGVLAVGFLWFVGWTGYWLVWDERGAHVAVGTARMVDALGISADPLSRTFLADEVVNSLLFFVVFFVHMLLPLAAVIVLWLHIVRLSKPRFLTGREMTTAILISLAVVSIAWPATSVEVAQMRRTSAGFGIDLLYLLPLYLTDRLSGGLLWLVLLGASVVSLSFPWWMRKARAALPKSQEERCTGCRQCLLDCPYNAISMVRTKEGDDVERARIVPDKCVSCGICVGSCNPAAIEHPMFALGETRRRMDAWARSAREGGEDAPSLAFLCARSAGAGLAVDVESGACPDLPGYRVVPVPCAGAVHPELIERALRGEAPGVLLVGCGADPTYRLGGHWMDLRLLGVRQPALRREKVDAGRVWFLQRDRSSLAELLRDAREFRSAGRAPSAAGGAAPIPARRWRHRAAATVAMVVACVLAVLVSDVSYTPAAAVECGLVVTFKHPGQKVEVKAPAADDPDVLPHMRGAPGSTERERVPVRMRVTIDGRLLLEKSYPPKGIFSDGASIATETIALDPGVHEVLVEIGDGPDAREWNHRHAERIEVRPHERRVLFFERREGFKLY